MLISLRLQAVETSDHGVGQTPSKFTASYVADGRDDIIHTLAHKSGPGFQGWNDPPIIFQLWDVQST